MRTNIELKLELRDPALARTIARRVAREHQVLEQTDTYYLVLGSTIKKRETFAAGGGHTTEYIRYQREASITPRPSDYTRYTPSEYREHFGEQQLPERCVVRKKREVYLAGDGAALVRIHIDDVEGLGSFLEFEAPISDEFQGPAASARVRDLREKLGPALGEPVSVGYADLIEQNTPGPDGPDGTEPDGTEPDGTEPGQTESTP